MNRDPKKHRIKCIEPYFTKSVKQEKLFEVRFNDRDYQEGDTVMMDSWDEVKNTIRGPYICADITYVLTDFEGLKEGWCVFGIKIYNIGNHM